MTIRPSPLEIKIGMEVYASSTRGIGGKIRSEPEDFIVEEVLLDGSKASVHPCRGTRQVSGRGRYLICLLIKRGWDTLVATEKIAREIGVSPDMISIAGIKDAHALTAQHISIGAVSPEKIKIRLKGVSLIPMRFSEEKISAKILLGNQFGIAVRSIMYDPAEAYGIIDETWRRSRVSAGLRTSLVIKDSER